MEVFSMAHGRLANLAQSSFIRTPVPFGTRICRNILAFSSGSTITVLDPAVGEGDLLLPLLEEDVYARLYGIEISAERAEIARNRLRRATIFTSSFESTVIPPRCMSLVLMNPPYLLVNGKRAEYRFLVEATEALIPGGVMGTIIPARSALDSRTIDFWCLHYERISAYKFPNRQSPGDESAFEDNTQMFVIGIKRAEPLDEVDETLKKQLMDYRWRKDSRSGVDIWAGGAPPPELPTSPIAHPYLVPEARLQPVLVVRKASDVMLIDALKTSGAHKSSEWATATTWSEKRVLGIPAMPYTGPAHVAAEVMTDILGGEVVHGPDQRPYLLAAFVCSMWNNVGIDPEVRHRLRQQGVKHVSVRQLQDRPVLGVLDLVGHQWRYYEGEEVFAFLRPWLRTLAQRAHAKRPPLYSLAPEDWELRVLAQFGLDKQLPGAAFPGLAPPQLHRVVAMGRSLDVKGRTAIQGEPGTGKTRMGTASAARQAYRWRYRNDAFTGRRQPAWIKRMRRAWLKNPLALKLLQLTPVYGYRLPNEGDVAQILEDPISEQIVAYRQTMTGQYLLPDDAGPAALPVSVTTPKKVTKEYAREIRAAWPQAEVVAIEHYTDIRHWMQRCVESRAPVVVGVFSHSQNRAFGREWMPAVLEKTTVRLEPDLDPPEEMREELVPILDAHDRVVEYRYRGSGALYTRERKATRFHCPDCFSVIRAVPGHQEPEKKDEDGVLKLTQEEEDEKLKRPVTSNIWFERKQRWCTCATRHNEERKRWSRQPLKAPLWTEVRTEATRRKHPQLSFAQWSRVMKHFQTQASIAARQAELPLRVAMTTGNTRLIEQLTEAACGEHDEAWDRLKALVLRYTPRPQQAALEQDEARMQQALVALAQRHALIRERLVAEAHRLLDWTPVFFQHVFAEAHLVAPQKQKKAAGTKLPTFAHGVRLVEVAPTEGGISLHEPDLDIPNGYVPQRDPEGVIIGYRDPITNECLVPLYSWRSRRMCGLVQADGIVRMKQRTYAFRMPPKDSFSPYEYTYRFYRKMLGLAIVDESHNGRGQATDIAHAHHLAMLAACGRELTSGTHYGGDIISFYHYWYRFNPRLWRALGFGWNDASKALKHYGVIQEWVKEQESDARKGTGQTNISVSTIPAPGLSAKLIPFLLEDLVYLTVLDVGAFMPPRFEIPEIISMEDPEVTAAYEQAQHLREKARQAFQTLQDEKERLVEQAKQGVVSSEVFQEFAAREAAVQQQMKQVQHEAGAQEAWARERDLLGAYIEVVKQLEYWSQQRVQAARTAKGTIPRWFAVLPCDKPFELWQTNRSEWGEIRGKTPLLRTPTLLWAHIYPMEKRLLEIVQRELGEGRRVMLYFEQNDERSMAKRLAWVLQHASIRPWTLPNATEAEDRQQAILDAVAAGNHVIIVPYRRVNEGLNLQSAIDTIIWVEMAMNLFLLDQASRRAWRLGKREEVRIYYLVYSGTASHSKLKKLGGQSGAAAAFAGEPAKGALVEEAGADRLMLARLSASLEHELTAEEVNADEDEDDPLNIGALTHAEGAEELKQAFQRRTREEQEALKAGRQWIGTEDHLAERLTEFFGKRERLWDATPKIRNVQRVVEGSAGSIMATEQLPLAEEQPPAAMQPQPPTSHQCSTSSVRKEQKAATTSSHLPSPTLHRLTTASSSVVASRTTLIFGDEDQILLARSKRGKAVTIEVHNIPALTLSAVALERTSSVQVIQGSLWECTNADEPEPPTSRPHADTQSLTTVQMSLW
jgi:catechol 2,3-dioxygenase-like lactoylglutathione lyase family enzyme